MNQGKICCFGEILLRMSPAFGGTWLKETSMPVYVGGAEANVASALATWGVPVTYCTAMPDNPLAREVVAYLAGKGIDVSPAVWILPGPATGDRLGVYYLPQGSDLQHAGVIYDRAHSAFAGLDVGMIDWDRVLDGCAWFHFSAITPALNARLAAVCMEALAAATRLGLRISVDLNYRPKLWQYGVAPVTVMPVLVAYADLVMGNLWAAESLLGIAVDKEIHKGEDYTAHALQTSTRIMEEFPRCRHVANTFRFEDKGLRYFGTLCGPSPAGTGGSPELYVSREFYTDRVVDKVGSGDCFMAGLLYGIQQGHDPARIINFAAAAAFGKLHEIGDATRQSVAQVTQILQQHAS